MIKTKQDFIKALRLRQTEDFQSAFRQGKKLKQGGLITYTKLNGLGYPRLGLALTKKIVPGAASRNQFKRIIRESFRLNQQALPSLDIVIVIISRFSYNNQVLLRDLDKQWSRLAVFYKRA